MKHILRIGHRGACGHEPENTLRSFRKAIALGADMIEFDVHRCASGEPVVIHDPTLERTTNGRGRVNRRTLASLRKLDAGKGEYVPSLEEVLELAAGKVRVNVELKGRNTPEETVKLVQSYIRKRAFTYPDIIISSFNHRLLLQVRALDTRLRIGLLATRVFPGIFTRAQSLRAYSIHMEKERVTPAFIASAHNYGFPVYAWRINNKQEIARFKTWGVDGIFSDFPERI